MPELLTIALIVLVVVVLLLPPFRGAVARVTVYEYQRGLRFRDGRLDGVLEPGAYWVYRPSTTIVAVDMREVVAPIPGQEVVTSDGFSVKLSLAVRQKVVDPVVAWTKVESYHGVVYSVVQVALRDVVGSMTIDDLLQHRTGVGPAVLERSAEPAKAVGVELVAVDVKDLMFPGPLKRTFAQVVEARQQGLAALEKARGETAALRNLANAARMVESNPSLLQLRLLQQLETSSGNTLVLGFPSSTTPLPVRPEGPGAGKAPELPAGRSLTDTADEE